jgi:hypothetical protein
MRKILIIGFVALLSLVLAYGFADAKVSGPCSDCHTMHNSQNGSYMAYDEDNEKSASPFGHLTLSSCWGCHSGTAPNIEPKIDVLLTGNYTAGGSFNATYIADDRNTHNVFDIPGMAADTYIKEPDEYTPPGYDGSTDWDSTKKLRCAGTYGCHGSHDSKATSDEGIAGFHHGSTAYRFLEVAAGNVGAGTAVDGIGSDDWEKGGATTTNHNLYKSDASNGISKYCANCHGDFHGDANTKSGSTWIRHPTDADIPDAWDITLNVDELVLYNPFAFTSFTGMSTKTMTGYDETDTDAKVMCLSCHRAHATDQNDILRFDYSTQQAGGGNGIYGCLGCHSRQR